jgi:transcriptional regulator
MYLPSHFAESRSEVMHALMQAHPFATLVTQGGMGLSADHLPLHLAAAIGPFGALQGHVARANPLWRNAADSEVLAIFQGPQAYVTPSWYETKRADGKAVPTWNYVVVHARGRLRVIDDPAWLRGQLETLVAEHEAGFAEPWQIADAPPDYIDRCWPPSSASRSSSAKSPANGRSARTSPGSIAPAWSPGCAHREADDALADRGTRRRHRDPMTLQQTELPAPGPDARAASAALSRLIAEEIGARGLALLRPLHGTGAVCAGPGLLRRGCAQVRRP